jgi:regulator of protease activity HflC (stomatin/prohibitin superfamily)
MVKVKFDDLKVGQKFVFAFDCLGTLYYWSYEKQLGNNVKCISKEGIYLMIPQIEIANKIKKEHVIDIIKNSGIDYDKKLVDSPISQFIRELCAERTIDEIVITDFHLLDNLLKTEIQRQVDEIDSGITIDYVRITSVDFPDDIRNLRLEK